MHTFLPFLDHIISHSSIQYLLVSPLQVDSCMRAGTGYDIHIDSAERLVEFDKDRKSRRNRDSDICSIHQDSGLC